MRPITLRSMSVRYAKPKRTRLITITALISEIHHGSPFDPLATKSQLMGEPRFAHERGGVAGTGRFPTLSRRRGHAGETWFPPRTRAVGERCSCLHDLDVGVEIGGVLVGDARDTFDEPAIDTRAELDRRPVRAH